MKILVGMDERATTLLYQFILVNRGHQVKITETGGKCINTYRKNLQVVRPKDFNSSLMCPYDVVILDQVLPDMNGLEICRKLKSSLGTRHITVIVHSVESRLTVFNAAFEAGADYYIPKGDSSVKNLTSLVRGILRRNGNLAETAPKRATSAQMMLAS